MTGNSDKTTLGRSANPEPNVFNSDGIPMLKSVSQFAAEEIGWLWPGRIPLGKLTMLVGDPGVGKSYLTAEMAARLSTGARWPDGAPSHGVAGDTIFMMCEDDPGDTLRPRLTAQNADLERVHVLEGHKSLRDGTSQFTTLDSGLEVLARALRCVANPRLVVIDPITAYMGKLDANNNSEVRGLMSRLGNLARKFNVAVVMVSHLNKDSASGTRTVYRTMGALSFCAAARAVYFVKKETENTRVITPAKQNLPLNRTAMTYRILDSGVLAWEHTDLAIAAEDIEADDEPVSAIDEAMNWLRSLLQAGPVSAKEAQVQAGADGISATTLRRAMRLSGVQSKREDDRWVWTLAQPAT